MKAFGWKFLVIAGCTLQASGATAQSVCNYNNPASPSYCTTADVSEQKARFRSLNDTFTANASSEANGQWRDTLFDQMRARLSDCSSQPANVTGCQFEVYRSFADKLEERLRRPNNAASNVAASTPLAPPSSDSTTVSDAAAEAQSAALDSTPETNTNGEIRESITVVDRPANVSNGPHFDKKPYSYRKLFVSVLTGILLWIVLCGPLAFRANRGYSGIKERKLLLVITYFIMAAAFSETIEFIYWVLICLPIAIWGPRVTAYPIRRRLLRFYGFDGPDLEEEFDEWCAKHSAVWANMRYGAVSRGQSNELAAIRQFLSHNTIGKCRAGPRHREVECGKCETIGCFESNCANYNFSDNNTCLECGHRAPLTGGY